MKKGFYLMMFEQNDYSHILLYKGRGIVEGLCGDYFEWEEVNLIEERGLSFREYLQLCRENGYVVYFLGV